MQQPEQDSESSGRNTNDMVRRGPHTILFRSALQMGDGRNFHGAKQLIMAIRIFRNLPTRRPTSPTLGRSSWISLIPPPPFPHSGAGQDSVLLNSFFTDVRFPHFVLVQQLMCRIWIHPSIHPHAPPSHDTSESGSRTCLTVHAR